MSQSGLRYCLGVVSLLWLATCLGCGQAEYNRKLLAAVDNVENSSRFGVLDYQPHPWLDKPFRMRLPWAITRPMNPSLSKWLSIRPTPGAIFQEGVMQEPTFFHVPGLLYTYQAVLPGSGSSQSAYSIHVGAEDVGLAADEATLDKVRDDLRAACPEDNNIAWKDVQIETIKGKTIPMRHLRAHGPGEMRYFGYSGESGLYKGPMVLDLYTLKDSEFRVFIAWYMPEHLQTQVKLDELAPLVAGTFERFGE